MPQLTPGALILLMDWGIHPFPALMYLTLDGWNFVNLFRNARHWLDHVTTNNTDLRVSHLQQAEVDDMGRFTFNDAWPIFSKPTCLELRNLDFDWNFKPKNEEIQDNPGSISLIDLSGKLTAGILSHINTCDSPDIKCCPLGRITDLPSSLDLSFSGIDDVDSICRLVPRSDTASLSFYDRPCFNDDVLEMLGDANYHDTEDILNVPNLARELSQFLDTCFSGNG